jgi:hypothetical protein
MTGAQNKTRRFEDPDVRFEGRFLYDSESVAAKIPHFEEFSDLRMSDLRTVSCTVKYPIMEPPHSEFSRLAEGFLRDGLSGYRTIVFR